MADRAASRGSSDGIHGAILEAGMGGARAVLEADLSESGRCRPDVGNPASGASLVESWSARAQERFSRRRTSGEAIGFPGADLELCARCRTAFVADTDAHQVSTDAGQSTAAESTGGTAGRSPYQVVQFGFGPARGQCTTDAEGTGGGRNRSGGSGCLGRSALACHTGRVARRAGRLHRAQPGLPSAGETGTGGL